MAPTASKIRTRTLFPRLTFRNRFVISSGRGGSGEDRVRSPAGEVGGHVRGVGADAAEERRVQAGEVAEADEVEARQVGDDPARVPWVAARVAHAGLDPREVRPEAGAPDDAGDLGPGAVVEDGPAAVDALHAPHAAQGRRRLPAQVDPDERVAAGASGEHPPAAPRVDGGGEEGAPDPPV